MMDRVGQSAPADVELVEVEVADGLAGVGGFFGFAHGFLEFFLEQVGGVLLGLQGLTEDGVAAVVLFFHGAGRFFHVVEHFRLHRGGVSNDGFRFRIDLQNRITAGAGHFKRAGMLGHIWRNDTPKGGSA